MTVESKEVYCPKCKKVTVHSPHPNDVACSSDYVICGECNKHRA